MTAPSTCPTCQTPLPGRPLLAFRAPPSEVECAGCRRRLQTSFSYRLLWCYQLAAVALFPVLSVWLLWEDRARFARAGLSDLLGAGLAALSAAALLALPLLLALQPRSEDALVATR